MKKLMIGLVGAVALCAGAEVASENIVGCQGLNVEGGARAMRSAATFLKIGANPTAVKISDIIQTKGYPGELTLCLYDDNVTRLAQYWYFSDEVVAEVSEDLGYSVSAGWYSLDTESNPNFDAGVQSADLPYGQGCVIDSVSSEAEYTSAGEVDSKKREFTIPGGSRKMMGNVLPRTIELGELKQTEGYPGELTLCTYDNNVTRQNQYWYFSEEVVAEVSEDLGFTVSAGWYILNQENEPDFLAGAQDFEITSGQGFVIDSVSSSAVLQFPGTIE